MDSQDLLRRMADTYAGAKTYVDRATARRVHVQSDSRFEQREISRTFLDRTQGFRWDTREGTSPDHVLLWSGQGPARIIHRGTSDYGPFVASLVATRFSPLASTTIPSLLFPREFGRSLVQDLENATVQGEEVVEGFRCRRLIGRWQDRTELTLWLDEDRYLIRQLNDRTEYPLAREAAALRDAHLQRREHAFVAGIARKELDRAFGGERLLAIPHWPYARPREDSHSITKIAYEPQIGVPIDASIFTYKRRKSS